MPRVALVHDYLNQRGGAERVALELTRIWADAPLYTSLYRPGSTFPEFAQRDVRTSFLQKLPVDEGFRNFFPLYPAAFASLGPIDADLVVSSSSAWAHMVRVSAGACHIVYCHTPARWLYGGEYLRASGRQRAIQPVTRPLRALDRRAAHRATHYVANSQTTRERIRKVYGLDATVVYPPVDVERFKPTPRGERLLVVSRLLPYKRVDLVVDAATRSDIGLDVVGAGPELEELKRRAGPTVRFHGKADDETVTYLMENCRAFCLPGTEDFGITPVEALAAGKPVVAFGAGGAMETVIDGFTGVLFHEQDPEAVCEAIAACDELDTSPDDIALTAQRFGPEPFAVMLEHAIALGCSRPH